MSRFLIFILLFSGDCECWSSYHPIWGATSSKRRWRRDHRPPDNSVFQARIQNSSHPNGTKIRRRCDTWDEQTNKQTRPTSRVYCASFQISSILSRVGTGSCYCYLYFHGRQHDEDGWQLFYSGRRLPPCLWYVCFDCCWAVSMIHQNLLHFRTRPSLPHP